MIYLKINTVYEWVLSFLYLLCYIAWLTVIKVASNAWIWNTIFEANVTSIAFESIRIIRIYLTSFLYWNLKQRMSMSIMSSFNFKENVASWTIIKLAFEAWIRNFIFQINVTWVTTESFWIVYISCNSLSFIHFL